MASCILRIHIYCYVVVSIGVVRMRVPILQDWIHWWRHCFHLFWMWRAFIILYIFVVSLYQKIWTIFPDPMIIRIPKPTSRATQITIPHSICHFVCSNITRYLVTSRQNLEGKNQNGIKAHNKHTKFTKIKKIHRQEVPEMLGQLLRLPHQRRGRNQQWERI